MRDQNHEFGKHTESESKNGLGKVSLDATKEFGWSKHAIMMTFSMNKCRS
jgi:hypothetical protein